MGSRTHLCTCLQCINIGAHTFEHRSLNFDHACMSLPYSTSLQCLCFLCLDKSLSAVCWSVLATCCGPRPRHWLANRSKTTSEMLCRQIQPCPIVCVLEGLQMPNGFRAFPPS